jgi:hemoglobin-like flavoprotein
MDAAMISAVKQSYGRALGNHDLMDDFYNKFIKSHSDIAKHFVNTDLKVQQEVLKQSLSMAILFPQENMIARHAMERIRKSHAHDALNIKPELYGHWLESLLAVVKESDPEFTPELEQQWRSVLGHVLDFIKSGY